MVRHFHEDLSKLKQELLKMGRTVEEMIGKAVNALLTGNEELVKQVLEHEKQINKLEIKIDDFGHSLLALGQPMAMDLRFVTMTLKINTDLERIGDHAVNIAERSINILSQTRIEKSVPIIEMAHAASKMLSDALNAFIHEDVDLARNVLKRDDEVDTYNDDIYIQVSQLVEQNPKQAQSGINLIMIAHNLERVADLANNIAEDVIYLKQGKEVRHHIEDGE